MYDHDDNSHKPVPPIVPPPPPTSKPSAREQNRATYDMVSGTVGLVPNIRRRDNIAQGLSVLVGAIIGALAGALVAPRWMPEVPLLWTKLMGMVAGGVVAAVLSGFVLMILGFTRLRGQKK